VTEQTFVRSTTLDCPADEAFRWHAREGAFERLSPPWERVEVVGRAGGIEPGARLELALRLGPLRLRWLAEHTDLVDGVLFRDVQRRGPFAAWTHTHRFEPAEGERSRLEDHVEYRLPFGILGDLVGGRRVRRRLDELFSYRHRTTAGDLRRHASAPNHRPMNVLITGSSGLIGSALSAFLTSGGHGVRRLVRRAPSAPGEHAWDPERGELDADALEGVDAVVHLAGENIAARRWSADQKARLRSSRVRGTELVAGAVAARGASAPALVCASATGFYGDRGDELLDETSAPGAGFLAELCGDWEAAARPAAEAGARVCHLRFGVVLSPKGGALAKMLTPFRLGVGGRLGSGRQYMSWIALDDAVAALHHALTHDAVSGPLNAVAPNPVTNAEYTRVLARVLKRPAVFPVPAFAARLAFGELADALLLSSQRVAPAALEASGFRFDYPELEGALRHVLGKSA